MTSKTVPILLVLCVGVTTFVSWYLLLQPELKNQDQNFELRLETLEHWEIRKSLESEQFEDRFAKGEMTLKVLGKNGSILEIQSSEVSSDIISDEIYWNIEEVSLVDRHSRKSIESDSYFLFPLNTKKQNYTFGVFGDRSHEFSFVKTEKDRHLEIYEFMAKDIYDISGSYDKYSEQKIYADQTTFYQVEPITGQIVSYKSLWQDYIESPKGKIIISNGEAEISQYSRDILVANASNLISLYWIYDTLIPILIIFSIIIGEGFVILYNKFQQGKSEIKTSKLAAIGELSARLSHDIRNPLSNINLALNSIQNEKDVNFSKNAQEKFEIISRNLGRISHQVDDVLDFVRMRPLKKEKLALHSLLKDSIDAIIVPKNIKIVMPPNDSSILGDSFQLQIVCRNLINNSIQAIGKNEGIITIRKNENSKNVLLEFEDTGTGFSYMDKKEIFELLSTTKQTGTGLGLVSCKQIIENHGGTISVKENPTRFIVKIPKNDSNP